VGDKDLSVFARPMLAYFNYYKPGRWNESDDGDFTSYDGSEVLKKDQGADILLAAGRVRKMAHLNHFIANAGEFPSVSRSLLDLPKLLFPPKKTTV
jgi:hypothetical protein